MSAPDPPRPDVSVVVPVRDRCPDPGALYGAFAAELDALGRSYEFLFVLDGGDERLLASLRALKREQPAAVHILVLSRPVGEATALAAGFERARGELVATLAPYFQVEPHGIVEAIRTVEEDGVDLVVGRRFPRRGSAINRLQAALFQWVVRTFTATRFHDIACSFRVMKAEVAKRLNLYGDLQRFIPIVALSQGFSVREIDLPQHPEDRPKRLYGPAVYLRRTLDVLTILFLGKFTRRPLRFFGMIGLGLFAVGFAVVGYLGVYRLMGLGGIADRPLLLLGILLLVLGVQSLSIGLLGEIIIFTHARQIREYRATEIR